MSAPTQEAPLEFNEPAGLSVRGTIVVLGGRGERAVVYQRFGARLAADSYRVRVLSETDSDAARIAEILADASAPRIVVGSDTGALRAVQIAQDGEIALDGLILAGLPLGSRGETFTGWDEELDVRTACPVHRGRLAEGIVTPGALADPVPANLSELAPPADLAVPVLVLHGDSDQLTSAAEAQRWVAGVTSAQFVVVRDGHHDVLNDATHRSVAATIVLWLERLRSGVEQVRVVT